MYDDPDDWASVEFGVRIYNVYGRWLTREQFHSYLALHSNELTPAPNIPASGRFNPAWPYHVWYFDGPQELENERWIRLLLSRWW
jgi:hypothetical protein